MDILTLKEDRSHLIKTCEDMVKAADTETRELTDPEMKTISELREEAKKLEAQIEQAEKSQALREQVLADSQAIRKPETRKAPNPDPSSNPDARRPLIEMPMRYGKLRAFSDELDAYRMGQWCRATLFSDQRARRFCADNGIEVRALSEGVNTAGGVLVPTEMERAIIDLREDYGVFRREVAVTPMGSDTLTIPRRTGGLTAYFNGEGGTFTESDKSWNDVGLVAKKMHVETRFSSELAEDAVINLADDIAREMAYAFAVKEDQCGFTGDGTATYGSIQGVEYLIDDGNHAGGQVAAVAGNNTYAEITAGDVISAMVILPQYADPSAKFYCSKLVKDLVFNRLKAAAGGNAIVDLQGRVTDTFLGHEIVVSQVLRAGTATADNAGNVIFLYGDLNMAVTFGQRRGISIARSEHVHWSTDQIALRATQRVDINVHDIGTATAAGAVVALVGGTA